MLSMLKYIPLQTLTFLESDLDCVGIENVREIGTRYRVCDGTRQ